MKVICIDKGSYHLTVGRVYDVVNINKKIGAYPKGFNSTDYLVVNNLNVSHYVEHELFKKLSDARDEKLEKLGI